MSFGSIARPSWSQTGVTARAPGSPAPSSRPTCLATPAGFQNSLCLQAQPSSGEEAPGPVGAPGSSQHPYCLGSSPPFLPPPPQAPRPPASETTALADHPCPGRCPPAALPLPCPPPPRLRLPLPGVPCITSQVAGGLGLRDSILDKQPSAPGVLSRGAAGCTFGSRPGWPAPAGLRPGEGGRPGCCGGLRKGRHSPTALTCLAGV